VAAIAATHHFRRRTQLQQAENERLAAELENTRRELKSAKRQALKALRDLEVARKALLKQSLHAATTHAPRSADSGWGVDDFPPTVRLRH